MKRNRIITQVFNKDGSLKAPEHFQLCGYTWTISLKFAEVHNVPAIDFMLKCDDIEDGKYLSMSIVFLRLHRGTTRRVEHTFDRQRNSYCFRRMITGIRHQSKGKVLASFPNDRFLLWKEINEKYDSPQPRSWIYHNLVTWNVLGDGRVEAHPTKNLSNRFHYGIDLKHLFTFDELPPRKFPKQWPKSEECLMNFFKPVWPRVPSVIFDFVFDKPKTFPVQQMLDIFGAYYHQWDFDEDYLLELNSLAIRHGFVSFMDGIKLGGDFEKTISLERHTDIVPCVPRNKIDAENIESERTWTVERFPESLEKPSVFKMFLPDSLQWNVSFFLSTFRDQKYLSIGGVLAGELKGNYMCTFHVEYTQETKKIRSFATRNLNHIENTICIPMFCRKDDLIYIGDDPIGNVFKVKFRMETTEFLSRFAFQPSPNDVTLKLGDKEIVVNKTFLAHHVHFFSALLFNENFNNHDKKVVEINSVGFEEMYTFLDALYHGTKIFDETHYYHVLRMADEWICEKVIRMVEKAIRRTSCKSVNKNKLAEKFNLNVLPENENNIKRRDEIKLETEPAVKKSRLEV